MTPLCPKCGWILEDAYDDEGYYCPNLACPKFNIEVSDKDADTYEDYDEDLLRGENTAATYKDYEDYDDFVLEDNSEDEETND